MTTQLSPGALVPITLVGSAAASDVITSRVAGDTNDRFVMNADGSMEWGPGNAAADATLRRSTTGTLQQSSGATAENFIIYNTTDSDSAPVNYERGVIGWSLTTNNFSIYTQAGGTGNSRPLALGTLGVSSIALVTSGSGRWNVSTVGHFQGVTDNAYDFGTSDAARPRACYLAGPSITKGSGTGVTLLSSGDVRRLTYKVTVDYTAFAAAALNGDKVIATLPAKSRIVAIYADTTTKYIGGAVATATLRLGSTAGGVEVLASHDVFTAAVTKGLADADLGTSMVRAAAIQGGYMPSFTATTALTARITTTGANTNALVQGSTTWYIEVEVLQ